MFDQPVLYHIAHLVVDVLDLIGGQVVRSFITNNNVTAGERDREARMGLA